MNFKQLTYFIAVAEELHFGRAADRLEMAQPPLSRQIRSLEESLGAVLFNRGRSAISLTQAGERLLERGKSIVAQLEDTKLEVQRLGEGAEGRLRIGFVGSATFGILPNIIKSFRTAYADINLSLFPMNNAQLHRSLISREIDVAFARPALKDSEFVTRHLLDEPLIVAVPDAYDEGTGGLIDLRSLKDPNFVLYPETPRPSFADVVLSSCENLNIDTGNRIWTMDLQTALSLVAIGEGICVVPSSVGSATRNGLRYMSIHPAIGATALSISYRLDEQGVHVNNFVRVAQSVARNVG
ncbi:LysR family transcriptional regulator [Thalassorhabdomicrobium marinisediminis]|uniref:LysR family transcriptional regulator n=1 Tax=Thalassorhabdomicrobium marinisediminis TaxID=2170577 RepID=A0A2T7FXB1_9RHOB|nr:LysR family transcriptional regulator [Thalassorhabdomicrobium marinisediminis]PVA06811.1 LysR family transcriptional regulator [Thalassorhabdomicrobium marinisediminis]